MAEDGDERARGCWRHASMHRASEGASPEQVPPYASMGSQHGAARAGCVIISLLLLRPLRQRRVRHLTLERTASQEEGRQGAQHMSTAEVHGDTKIFFPSLN